MIGAIDFGSDRPALLLEGKDQAISYRELGQRVADVRQLLRGLARPALVFQFAGNSAASVTTYLACLAEKIPLGFGEPSPAARTRVIAAYMPTAVLLPESDGVPAADYEIAGHVVGRLVLWHRRGNAPYAVQPHETLALLLATSGSTGDAKCVRLSLGNLEANARSIARYLEIGPSEVAAQSLPIHYSYGLSVLNSHLVAGGAVLLTQHSFLRPEFWRAAEQGGATSFAGVPYMYETLHRLRLMPADKVPTLRTLTQAGGPLRVELVRHFHEGAARRQARFFVMYGQTEATARISYVPPDRLTEKLGTVGIAIPDGVLRLEPVDGAPNLHQLHYRGPNVMLGYASAPADLARGDEQRGELATGDLAESDADGFFRITGRLARFAKLFGKRVNLASVEAEAEKTFAVRTAVLDGGDYLRVFLEAATDETATKVRAHLAELLGVPPLAIKTELLAQIPLTASGKKDYKALA
jgi:acyl-CoA synthetase (AMP-forming)/AMP-acid ligase II